MSEEFDFPSEGSKAEEYSFKNFDRADDVHDMDIDEHNWR